jgi:phosphoenolpyruvate carboxylase
MRGAGAEIAAARPTAPPSSGSARRAFADDRAVLLDVFTEVVAASEGPEALALHDRAVELARHARAGDEAAAPALAALAAELDLPRAEVLVRSLTRWFQLINLAEDNERIRRLRAREAAEAPAPRRGGLRQAVQRLARAGDPEDVARRLEHAEVRLVLTAHPTEARRRTTLEKLARIFDVLRELDERPGTPIDDARRRLLHAVQELWTSDELRAVAPTALDEVRSSLGFFVDTLAETVPALYREVEAALADAFPGEAPPVPPFIAFGSWIGGDRDGNPNVTADVTAEALTLMRDECLAYLDARLATLVRRISVSERVAGAAAGLEPLFALAAEQLPDAARRAAAQHPEEPYRRALSLMRERLAATRGGRPGGYERPAGLLADLRAVERSLGTGGGALLAAGDLHDVIRQVEVFGFHFSRLDVREHAGRHRAALDEVLSTLGVVDGYAALPVEARVDVLCREIATRRPLVPADLSRLSQATQDVVGTFRMLREQVVDAHPGVVEAYVVSGTEGPADLLEVLLLMKESGLADPGGGGARLRIVPLFEAAATLDAAPDTMDRLLALAPYRAALRGVGDEQEIMVGYSDSNKDAGYVASAWATYRAQTRIARVLTRHGVSWTFFHGRGGALGRGGGPTNVAIHALPPGTVGGRLKLTEQGEVLADRYLVREVAHRELELTASAALASTVPRRDEPGAAVAVARHEEIMAGMAARSMAAYRALVHEDPDFARFFAAVTPVDEISRLRLGSRPARRRPDGGIESLRAIPWVFAWTQTRMVLPGWYGLGTALEWAREEHGLERLREMERGWPFAAGLISNAEMACSKADLDIARRYVELWDDEEPRERIWRSIVEELDRTRRELLLVCDVERLLDRAPVLQASIARRNPYVDPLSFLQIEVLRRRRAARDDDEPLGRVTLLTVNGIAGGLRNTG